MVKSAYIHIPFCKQKCHYCSFVSFPHFEKKEQYLCALKKQILIEYQGEELKTLYFGGGTPSLFSPNEVNSLIKMFKLADDAEVTLELNPETVNQEYFNDLAKTRVNRLSVGSQSFDNEILDLIGRRHKAEDIFRVVNDARNVGFENISLDFIYGLPNQTVESFISDLENAIELGVEHISLYGLKIDEDCYFAKFPPKNIADDDMQAQMYLKAIEILTKNGFEHYEISNFSRCDKYSRHNVTYWKNQEYYGFGLAAHGYVDGVRYSNIAELSKYLCEPCQKASEQTLSTQEKLEEEIFLGLRLLKGININDIQKKFDIDFEKKYSYVLNKYIGQGFLKKENNFLRFGKEGILVSNYILADFLE